MNNSNKNTYIDKSMFQTVQDLQEFFLWCQQAKIKAVKVGDIEVQFSDLAFIDIIAPEIAQQASEERDTSKTMVDTAAEEADEDLLFWSSKA